MAVLGFIGWFLIEILKYVERKLVGWRDARMPVWAPFSGKTRGNGVCAEDRDRRNKYFYI